MAYTDIDKPSDYFETVLWSSVDTSIDTLDFQPDWVWIKSRTNADTQVLFDSVRGAGERLSSSSTGAESTKTDELTAFNSDGFTLGTGSNVNRASNNNVAWSWKAGTSFTNDASATGIGTIDSTGSVNTDAGFSIVSYTGNGSAGATIGHGLGVTPKMFIVKSRSLAQDFTVYNEYIGNTNGLFLNSTAASTGDSSYFNNTSPTSSVFTVGTNARGNTNGATYIAYCFNDVQGYSKFGSYSSNSNADGPFVYLGFKPAFLIVKCTTAAEGWAIMDSTREPTNHASFKTLSANTSGSEGSLVIDFLSNGFKPRQVSGQINKSGSHSYIYMAFAEQPFVTSTGVPATAR